MKIFKSIMLSGLIASLLTQCKDNDNSHNEFSVNIGKKVEFSAGNLQYQANTNTWRFADNQYDIIGADNSNISPSYDGWIDLFGWGTSGWNSGAKAYQPYDTSTNYSDYLIDNNTKISMAGDYAKADWGVNCKIINAEGEFRTLTNYEWNYLINQRPNAHTKRGMAEINGIFGFVVLPDAWSQPSGTSFDSGEKTNKYTTEQWKKMEKNGAIFLPAAGYRNGTDIADTNFGYYWSCSVDGNYAHYLYFRTNNYIDVGRGLRNCGLSVRLVRDLE